MRKLLLGIDLGSSSVKVCLLDAKTGKSIIAKAFPAVEMPIQSTQSGWAEQDPEMWWGYVKEGIAFVRQAADVQVGELAAIGIAYQMHGLVCVNKSHQVLRSSIIWCDSRAVAQGEKAFQSLGAEYCLPHLLNSPGNFTASKLRWVIENQPELAEQIYKIMLPGDFIAMKLSGEILTSETGLSEGIFWDFKQNGLSERLLAEMQIPKDWIPEAVPSFSLQGKVSASASAETGLEVGIPIAYRAGDQPNNAFSLQVLHPGELATTAGTSGTVYGVANTPVYDPKSRVNTFVHVNHSQRTPSYGVLLCVNGTGILNSWLKRMLGGNSLRYEDMNTLASKAPLGADKLTFLPFGNGVERILQNKPVGAHLLGLDLLKHEQGHLLRAAQEGIVSALTYGFRIMKDMGMNLATVKAGHANMFLSPIFRETFVQMNQVNLELYDTDGAQGAARGAGLGAGIFASEEEAFLGLTKLQTLAPNPAIADRYEEVYQVWLARLEQLTANPESY
uniref:xylulokinase n=1 Tax=Algoriphagus sp. TaxID=1872435 RepID=UPI0040481AB2